MAPYGLFTVPPAAAIEVAGAVAVAIVRVRIAAVGKKRGVVFGDDDLGVRELQVAHGEDLRKPATGGSGSLKAALAASIPVSIMPIFDSGPRARLAQRQRVPGVRYFVYGQGVIEQRPDAMHGVHLTTPGTFQSSRPGRPECSQSGR